MKRWALKAIYTVAYYIGLFDLLFFINKRPIIITYHNVIDDDLYDESMHLSLTQKASVFEKQLSIIDYKLPISADLENGRVLITFDDGYSNNLYVALPILKKYNIHATFFIPASYFDGAKFLWVDQILMWLTFVPKGNYKLLGKLIHLNTFPDRQNALRQLWQLLLNDYTNKNRLLDQMESEHSFSSLQISDSIRKQRYEGLNATEIAVLVNAGYRVACHSYSHEILPNLSNEELDEDFRRCEAHLSSYNSSWYSYPFGRDYEVDPRVVEKCRSSLFSKAFVNHRKKSNDCFKIPRINMPESDDKILIYAELSGFASTLRAVGLFVRKLFLQRRMGSEHMDVTLYEERKVSRVDTASNEN